MRHIWSAAALVTALWIGAADARYTCDSVARRYDLDPDGFVFTRTSSCGRRTARCVWRFQGGRVREFTLTHQRKRT
jgi:hypothetical protein